MQSLLDARVGNVWRWGVSTAMPQTNSAWPSLLCQNLWLWHNLLWFRRRCTLPLCLVHKCLDSILFYRRKEAGCARPGYLVAVAGTHGQWKLKEACKIYWKGCMQSTANKLFIPSLKQKNIHFSIWHHICLTQSLQYEV